MRRNLFPLTTQNTTAPTTNMPIGDPFTSLQREINRMFDDAWRGLGTVANTGEALMAPRVDFSEDDNSLYVTAELPGLSEKDVDVSFEDGILRLTGEKSQSHEDSQRNVHVSERVYGRFVREIPIGREVKSDQIDARFKDGVLTITLPKAAEAETSRKIEVKRAA
jgi:HSP20 family protein